MATLSEIRNDVADAINRTGLSTQIDKAINAAIKYYAVRRFWFNEGTTDITTAASQQSYASTDGVPSPISEIDVVTMNTASSSQYTLIPRTYQYIRDVNTSGSTFTGYPQDFAWYENKLWLYPTPDAAYTATISYLKGYSDLSANGDSNDFTNNAAELIEYRAAWWVSTNIIRDDAMSARFKGMEIDEFRNLRQKTAQLVTTGRIRPTKF